MTMFPDSAQNFRDPTDIDSFLGLFAHQLGRVSLRNYLKGTVLDVGTGCGYMVKHLQDRGIDCYGLEGDAARAGFARSITKQPEKIIQADARHMPFPDNTFDLVLSTMLYDHQNVDYDPVWTDQGLVAEPTYSLRAGDPIYGQRNPLRDQKGIKNEILRVAKPGGLYLVRDFFPFLTYMDSFFEGFDRVGNIPCFIVLRKPTHPTLQSKE